MPLSSTGRKHGVVLTFPLCQACSGRPSPFEEEPVNRAPIIRCVVALGAAALAVALGAGMAAAAPAGLTQAHQNGIQGTGLVANGIQGSGFTVTGINGGGATTNGIQGSGFTGHGIEGTG
jgi:hypothetical protein